MAHLRVGAENMGADEVGAGYHEGRLPDTQKNPRYNALPGVTEPTCDYMAYPSLASFRYTKRKLMGSIYHTFKATTGRWYLHHNSMGAL